MLTYAYVSRNRNVRGHLFGFVEFIKVHDVDKLNKALYNVFFWDNPLFAKVAKFDRFGNNVCGERGSGDGEKNLREEGEKNLRAGVGKNLRGDGGMGRNKVLERVKEEAL